MFHSPRKNISAFIQSKNQQIKTLKQKIMGSRVTTDDLHLAKSRLDSLRSSHIQLEREDHLQLKQVLKASQQAVTDLIKKKTKLQEQLQAHCKDTQEMGLLEKQLCQKKQRADQFHKEAIQNRQKLIERSNKKKEQIIELEQEVQLKRKQLAMQRDISEQLQNARVELDGKTARVQADLASIQEQNGRLRETLRKQMEELNKMEHQKENEELRVENLQLRIEKEEKSCQNLQQKIQAAQAFMQRLAEDKVIYVKEAETESNIDALLKMCQDSNQAKIQEQADCEVEMGECRAKIERAQEKRAALLVLLKDKEENLAQLKSKSAEDSNVLKLLADKKVYEGNVQPAKMEQPARNKQIQSPGAQLKKDLLELMATSDNFFMPAP